MLNFFKPSHVKRAERVLEAVDKYVAYNRDLMTPEALNSVNTARETYHAVMQTRHKENLVQEEETLKKVCDGALKNYKMDPVKENLEVIIVAIVVALGIRSYIVQPFKIPTSSMQPTLNGLIGTPINPLDAKPNVLKQGWEYIWRGRNYTELKAPQASGNLTITEIAQKSTAMFFTRTTVKFSDGSTQTCYAPATQLFRDLWLENEQPSLRPVEQRGPGIRLPVEDFSIKSLNIPVTSGKVLACGSVDSGDQLLVDKFSYHFRRPNRGEVFVFNTMGVATDPEKGIAMPHNNIPSQHYIKRLVGVPNDKLVLAPPDLLINGELPTAAGILKVIESKDNPGRDENVNKLHGYTGLPLSARRPTQEQVKSDTVDYQGQPVTQYSLGNTQYFAMGDNSAHSSDSRYWGAVPQQNLVGPAWAVYWPFSPHWGLIR